MTPKEKALYLYDKFQQYYWHEVDGYMPDSIETINTVLKVIDEIREVADAFSETENSFWEQCKCEVIKLK